MEQQRAALEESAIGRHLLSSRYETKNLLIYGGIQSKVNLHQGLMQTCTNNLKLTPIFSKSIMVRRQLALF